MSALVFLVHHRSVDLVGMTAANALRDRMGLAETLLELRRDDVFVFEGASADDADAWTKAFTSHTHWFNPNKHRYGLYAASSGAVGAARDRSAWPAPWIDGMLASDRPDLAGRSGVEGLSSWLAMDPSEGLVQSVLSWDLEDGFGGLPEGHWPAGTIAVLRGQLWTARVRAGDAQAARELVEGFVVARSRDAGLLVHPHVEGWANVS